MKTRPLSTAALLGAACLTLANPASAAEYFLRAAPVTNTMPDGVSVIQWGFARDTAFGVRDGAVTIPGPVLTVPPGDNVLTIRLDNDLPEPISIVINGQFPTNAPMPVRHNDGRVRSFTHETPPGNGSPVTYTWPNVRPGTFLYLSGSHPQVQVPMGLYGAMKKDTNNGVAYPGASYASDVVLLYSEIDPVLNNAVGTDDFGPGKSMTSTVDYKARYFLINGVPFTNGQAPIPAGDPGKTNLLRFLNASSEAHVPILNGFYLRQIAEDGNQYPFPRNQYSVHLPPQKTLDALVLAPPAGTNAIYDRRLGLVSGTNSPGGMLAYLSFSFTPPMFTSQPANQTIGEGATTTFSVSASGSTPISYQWKRNSANLANGGNISGATSPTLVLTNLLTTQAGTYSVAASNVQGSVLSADATLTISPTRAEAVDATGLTWTSGGASPWLAQTVVRNDGVDAAQSGATPNNGESWLETVVTGPGTLTFWWKVSSQTNSDLLRLYANGAAQTGFSISGEVDWQFRTFAVPAGSQTLRWRYNKNASLVAGQDRGWLDQVQFTPPGPSVAPMITGNPSSLTNSAGSTVMFSAAASGTAPLIYQWRFNGTNLPNGGNVSGTTTPTLTLTSVGAAQAGAYSMRVTNISGSATSLVATLTVTSPPPATTIAEAVDTPGRTYQNAGNTAWFPQTAINHDGSDAARSGVITDGQNTRLETYVNGPGTVSFWWKVSSEPVNDQLRFYIGATEMARIAGEVDWQFRTFAIPSGSQILLKWRYSKSNGVNAGQDAGFVDQIIITP